MISVIIHWDHKEAMDHSNLRFLYQFWDYACRSFGIPVGSTFFVDCENSLGTLRPPNPVVYTLQDALSIVISQGYTPVYVHGSGETDLRNFEHPEDACYIFGPNYDKLPLPDGCVSVRIPMFAEPNTLFSQSCLPIILYDRIKG